MPHFLYTYSNAVYITSVQGWDRTSAAGSRCQSISDLIQPTQPMNHEIAQSRPAHRELHALLFAISVWVL